MGSRLVGSILTETAPQPFRAIDFHWRAGFSTPAVFNIVEQKVPGEDPEFVQSLPAVALELDDLPTFDS